MNSRILLFVIILISVLLSCSTKYVSQEAESFVKATESIGKNSLKVYESAAEREVRFLISYVIKKGSITPEDFQRKVLTDERYRIREKTVKVLSSYGKVLKILLCDDNLDLGASVVGFEKSLKSISQRHNNFISPERSGIIKSIVSDLLKAITYRKKRRCALRLMESTHPIVEKLIAKMAEELMKIKMLTDNFLGMEFKNRVAELWPGKIPDRVKYAELGLKIVAKRKKIMNVFDCAIKSVKAIPPSHLKLMENLKDGKVSAKVINQLLDKAIEFEESYLRAMKGGA